MRRSLKYPMTGLALGAASAALTDLFIQYNEIKKNGAPIWENVNWSKIIKTACVGASIGAVVGYILYECAIEKDAQKDFDADGYLIQILRKQNIREDKKLYNEAIHYRNDIKNFVRENYKGKLVAPPLNWGSAARGTAISSKFDLDIIIPFSKTSFSSLHEMYQSVYKTFYYKYSHGNTRIGVRKQNKSIGITIASKEGELHYDVVPGREINDYKINKELNLFKKDSLWSDQSRVKTNIDAHRHLTKNRPLERDVIKLLKTYRDNNGFPISSILLQSLVMESFNNRKVSSSIYYNLLHSMGYISEKLPYANILAPGNTNISLSKGLNNYEKINIANQIKHDLSDIIANKSLLTDIFII